MILNILLILGVTLSNFWIYWIFKNNFFIGELLIIETALLVFAIFPGKRKLISMFSIIILLYLSLFLTLNYFDKSIFSVSTIESIRIDQRQSFYAHELGRIYQNRIGLFYFDNLQVIFGKMSDNFFSALDFNSYFSPALISEYGKFSLFLSPLFLLGALLIIKDIKKIPIIYLLIALCVSTITHLDSILEPLIMFPFISLCIVIGFAKIIEKTRDLVSKT